MKERRALLEKDKKDLVDIISDQDKIIKSQNKDISDLKDKIIKLELKQSWFKGRLFAAGGMRAMIISIIIIICLIAGVLIFLKVFKK